MNISRFSHFLASVCVQQLETLSGNRRMGRRKWCQGTYYSTPSLYDRLGLVGSLAESSPQEYLLCMTPSSWVFHNTSIPHPFKPTSRNSTTVPAPGNFTVPWFPRSQPQLCTLFIKFPSNYLHLDMLSASFWDPDQHTSYSTLFYNLTSKSLKNEHDEVEMNGKMKGFAIQYL